MANTELREALNKVVVEGTLAEIRSNEWKNENGKGISIELDIETDEFSVHTLKGMSSFKTKEGKESKKAKAFETMINEYKSIANSSREEADKIRAEGKLGLNEYFTNDELKSYPELTLNFARRQSKEEFDPKAEFDVELFVKNVAQERANGEETERAVLNGYIPLYGGKVIPFSFVVTEEGSEFVADNYEKNSTVNVYGEIVNYKERTEKEKESAFGKPKVEVKTKTKREFLVTAGLDPYDEDSKKVFNPEIIEKALNEREIDLEQKQKQSNNTGSSNNNNKKGGFGGKPSTTNNKPVTIADDDLPF
ncbi:hypothetical protein [Bacillus safensis]|uniref:hypothetical protein n=1 Tax=Bacillus safensis TaxID=561879 RepID=UPI003C1453C4